MVLGQQTAIAAFITSVALFEITTPFPIFNFLAYQSLASEHARLARLWLQSPPDPFRCHQLPYMAKQRSTSQTL